MMTENMADLRYPIGEFEHTGEVTGAQLRLWIDEIEALPEQLREAVQGLTDDQLDTRYREGGWTVRQVAHHIGDSHLNSYIRIKLALTENTPTVKTYYEDRWAELADYHLVPIETSLQFIAHLHARWVVLLRSLKPDQWLREFMHPDIGIVQVGWNIGLYSWHGSHHLAHITSLIQREGWR